MLESLPQWVDVIALLAISLLLGVLVTLIQPGTGIRERIYDSLQNGLLVTVVITLIQAQFVNDEFEDLRDQILEPNAVSEIDSAISVLAAGPYKDSLASYRDFYSRRLSEAGDGDILLLNQEQVITEWRRMFNGSTDSISATNYISEEFWLSDEDFGGVQKSTHEAALAKGVSVRRLFIFDDPLSMEQLPRLLEIVEDQRDIGVDVRLISRAKLESSTIFLKNKSYIGGAIDFVVYDSAYTLINTHDPETRLITSGILSNKRRRVDAAQEMFVSLWSISSKPSDILITESTL